ncbi:RagB/SusD family nutrient uptake outer membrane protein [Membranihabitans maritimus]|uniref:RagB/SusD family nutrient uptake outer membrane protein n=1 Tax=Membranihabitans maritimus TaxID=2904244 RepID=UPI001F44CD35|nr:RagB/SusD family nutrient uptake outer membrane protein [Membranihabitans maritimus]
MSNKYITLILAFVIISACNDEFLERLPLDKISDSNYWKTASDIELFANQFYTKLYDFRLAWYRDDNFGDNQVPNTPNSYTWGNYTVPTSGGGWGKSDWLDIRSCNYALVRISEMEKTPDILVGEGEIRFFKSFFYFQKLKRYGDVPWYNTDLSTDSEELYKGRDSRDVVVDNMVSDLDFAINHLPETSGADRLTKYAALALKSDVLLYEGTFRKYHDVVGGYEDLLRSASEACEEIINSGLFSIYSTQNPTQDYFDLFVQYELKGNPEGIMVQRYLTDLRMHNNTRQSGEAYTGYSKDFINSYLCKDGLPIALSPMYNGDAEWADEIANRDPRLKQSIYTSDRPYRIYDDGSVAIKELPEFINYCPTSYWITKAYSPYERDRLPSSAITDDFIFRYAKVLLNYAEAKAELGECTQDILDITINQLRDRVSMPHLNSEVGFDDPNWPDWEIAVEPLMNEIRRERRIELCAEGIRWDDIVRWKAGKLLENEMTILGARDPSTGEYKDVYPSLETRVWEDKMYLYPIPRQELTLNENLVQNPGWE